MKYTFIFSLIIAAAIMTSCGDSGSDSVTVDHVKNSATAVEGAEEDRAPVMEFDELVLDFGSITQGDKITEVFTFTNTGNAELIITSAKGSCGCTIPKYPRKPIKPGEKGEITVKFDSKDKNGKQHKKIHIVGNTTPPTNTVAIKGEVLAPELIEG